MADLSITINERLGVYGGEPTVKWGSLVFGTDNWAFQGNLGLSVTKPINETLTPSAALADFEVTKIIEETLDTDDSIVLGATKIIQESLSVSSAMDKLKLKDSEGFYRIFRGNTTEGEEKVVSDYTETSDPSDTWSEVTTSSTTWS